MLLIKAFRLEEKETEMKKEYNKLHERYTEVLRSHCDLMERVKILIGSDEGLASLGGANLMSFSYNANKMLPKRNELESSNEENEVDAIYKNDALNASAPRQAWVDSDLSLEDASIIEDIEDIPRDRDRDSHSLTGIFILLVSLLLDCFKLDTTLCIIYCFALQ